MGKQQFKVFAFMLITLALAWSGVPIVAQQTADQLLLEMQRLDLSDQEPTVQLRIQLAFADLLVALNKEELADSIQSDSAALAKQENDPLLYIQLFEHANRLFQFEKASLYASKTGKNQPRLARQMLIEQYRSGDTSAFKESKIKFDDFFSALKMATVMVEVGDYDAVSKFVANVELVDDPNDPRAIAGFTYQGIAEKYHEQGDEANAKHYIDQAVKVGGNLYYSGYSIQVTKRVIYRELTKDFDNFATRAEAYRGHQGRELLSLYATALYENGMYEKAKQVMRRIDEKEDAEYSLIHLAWHQAKQNQFNAARTTIDEINKPDYRFRANVFLAIQLTEAGKLNEADVLLDRLEKNFETLKGDHKRLYYPLAYALGNRDDHVRIRKSIAAQATDLDKANWILAMLKGITKAKFY